MKIFDFQFIRLNFYCLYDTIKVKCWGYHFMANINYVLEGNQKITNGGDMLLLDGGLTKRYISSYTVIDETNKDQYSFWKGALGVALFGSVGAVAGIGGKNKKEYLIAVEWKDGDKSLILINDEYYKVFVKSMF